MLKNDDEDHEVKVDSYVLESSVHLPTDINLLWDAIRKCLTLISRFIEGERSLGWRKHQWWLSKIRRRFMAAPYAPSDGK